MGRKNWSLCSGLTVCSTLCEPSALRALLRNGQELTSQSLCDLSFGSHLVALQEPANDDDEAGIL